MALQSHVIKSNRLDARFKTSQIRFTIDIAKQHLQTLRVTSHFTSQLKNSAIAKPLQTAGEHFFPVNFFTGDFQRLSEMARTAAQGSHAFCAFGIKAEPCSLLALIPCVSNPVVCLSAKKKKAAECVALVACL